MFIMNNIRFGTGGAFPDRSGELRNRKNPLNNAKKSTDYTVTLGEGILPSNNYFDSYSRSNPLNQQPTNPNVQQDVVKIADQILKKAYISRITDYSSYGNIKEMVKRAKQNNLGSNSALAPALLKYAEKHHAPYTQRAKLTYYVNNGQNPAEYLKISPPIKIEKSSFDQQFYLDILKEQGIKNQIPNINFEPTELKKYQVKNPISPEKRAELNQQIEKSGSETLKYYPTELQQNETFSKIIQQADKLSHQIINFEKKGSDLSGNPSIELEYCKNFMGKLREIALKGPGLLSSNPMVLEIVGEFVTKIAKNLQLSEIGIKAPSIFNNSPESMAIKDFFINCHKAQNAYEKVDNAKGIGASDLNYQINQTIQKTKILPQLVAEIETRRDLKKVSNDDNTLKGQLKKHLRHSAAVLPEIESKLTENYQEFKKLGLDNIDTLQKKLANPQAFTLEYPVIQKAIGLKAATSQVENNFAMINNYLKTTHTLEQNIKEIARQDPVKKVKHNLEKYGGHQIKQVANEICNFLPGGRKGIPKIVGSAGDIGSVLMYELGGGRPLHEALKIKDKHWVGLASEKLKTWEKGFPNLEAPIDPGLAKILASKVSLVTAVNEWFHGAIEEHLGTKDGDKEREIRKTYLNLLDVVLNEKEAPRINQEKSKVLGLDVGYIYKDCQQNAKPIDPQLVQQDPAIVYSRFAQVRDISEKLTNNRAGFFQEMRFQKSYENKQATNLAKAFANIQDGKVGNKSPLDDQFINYLKDVYNTDKFQTTNYNDWGFVMLRLSAVSIFTLMFSIINKNFEIGSDNKLLRDQRFYVYNNNVNIVRNAPLA